MQKIAFFLTTILIITNCNSKALKEDTTEPILNLNDSTKIVNDTILTDTTEVDSLTKSIANALQKDSNFLEIKDSLTVDDTTIVDDTTVTEMPDTTKILNFKYVNGSGVNFRNDANTNSDIISQLYTNNKVNVIDSTKKWQKIVFQNDTGWVFGNFLSTKKVKTYSKQPVENSSKLNLEMKKVTEYPDNPRVKVKGIYVTRNIAPHRRLNDLLKFADTSQVNAFVIDVKDDEGWMLFHTKSAEKYAPKANRNPRVKNIKKLMDKLKAHNIYPIARIVCFKDPMYVKEHSDRAITYKESGALFQSSDGLHWATAYDRKLWDYNISVAIEAAKAGFREIQFDYVRFPAYSKNSTLDFKNTKNETKTEAIHHFLQLAYDSLSKYQAYTSADVFGLVTSIKGSFGIGQQWEAISSSVDYICPMMYPSHYYDGTYGIKHPDTKPYEILARGVRDGNKKNNNLKYPAIIRPWIQDFTAVWVKNHLRYGAKEIKLQAKGMSDNGVDEYLIWNARNVYSAKGMDK